MQERRIRGFTLIELMIVMVIIAILAAVAFPSYQSSLRKSNRAAAKSQMLDLANRQQQFLLVNRQYAAYSDITTSGYVLPADVSKYYTPSIVTSTGPPAFTITFTPVAGTAQAVDGALTINNQNVKTPADKW